MLPHLVQGFPWINHRTLAEVLETEALLGKHPLSAGEIARLKFLINRARSAGLPDAPPKGAA